MTPRPIPHLLHALDKAFGYRTYADGEMNRRKSTFRQRERSPGRRAGAFCEHENEVRAAHRYSKLQPSGEIAGRLARQAQGSPQAAGQAGGFIGDAQTPKPGARPVGRHPRHPYEARFLQAFDQVTRQVRSGCAAVEQLPSGADLRGLGTLGKDRRLERHRHAALQGRLDTRRTACSPRNWTGTGSNGRCGPADPRGVPLAGGRGGQYIEQAETAEREAIPHSFVVCWWPLPSCFSSRAAKPARQGKAEAFIAEVLAAGDPEALATVLAARLSASPCAKLLAKYSRRYRCRARSS